MDKINEQTDKNITEIITDNETITLYNIIKGCYLDLINNPNSKYYGNRIVRIIIRYDIKRNKIEIGTISRCGGGFNSKYYDEYNTNITEGSIFNLDMAKCILGKISTCELMEKKIYLHVIYNYNKNSLIFSNRYYEIKKYTDMYYYYINKN